MNIYRILSILRDIRAVQRGRVPQRLWNRAVGRMLASIGRKLYR